MVRIMVQVTEAQQKELKRLARERHTSVSEVVRRGVDMAIGSGMMDPEVRKRAREAVGFANSGLTDLAENHDKYFVEALEQ
jgi:Arc/MetJ-type ribon-helix-helix transcriptional regulator